MASVCRVTTVIAMTCLPTLRLSEFRTQITLKNTLGRLSFHAAAASHSGNYSRNQQLSPIFCLA